MQQEIAVDVLVVGSGAGGLAAAVAASCLGLSVLVAEKSRWIGGTTAISGGFLWIPNNPVSRADGVVDSFDDARTYLRHEAGNHFDAERVEAFLRAGPEAVEFFVAKTHVQFEAASAFSDYHPGAPGGRSGGRSIKAKPYDAAGLGDALALLRPPLPELTFAGLMVGSGPEMKHFFNATRSLRSAAYVVGRLAGHARDMVLHGRGMTLTNGNALAARLLRSALDLGVTLRTLSPVVKLLHGGRCVEGAVLRVNGRDLAVRARRGVVLAAGGFPQDRARRRRLFAHEDTNDGHNSPAPETNTGDGLSLGESVGGAIEEGYPNAAAWVPVSRVPRADGSSGVFPHFIDRAKPGLIAVRRDGRRFVNEADSYHDFVQALFRAEGAGTSPHAFLVVDHAFIRRFGLGFVKPFPMPVGPHVRSGYVARAASIDALARKAGIDPVGLAKTVRLWNREAAVGTDTQFGKGDTAYNRINGDPAFAPNPCMAPIAVPPFYALRVVVGDLGTFAGLRTDGRARVLDADGAPIVGLYAAGNDMASLMGGNYPGGGITLGPALTFGYVAAMDMVERASESARAAD
jgi:succinate dehydrogenase/fumarate reductase flavoprotein subunit